MPTDAVTDLQENWGGRDAKARSDEMRLSILGKGSEDGVEDRVAESNLSHEQRKTPRKN